MGVDGRPPSDHLASSVRVRLRLDGKEPVEVILAPWWYLDEHGIVLAEHDRLQVEGTDESDGHAVIARKLRAGDRELELRDEQGKPLWTEKREKPATSPPVE